jgi:MFS family permease
VDVRQEQDGQRAWAVVGAAAALLAVAQGFRSSLGLFLSPINTSTGLGLAAVSFALAASQLAAGLAQPCATRLAERVGVRSTIVAGAIVTAAAIALLPLLMSGAALTAGLALIAVGGTLLASTPVLLAAVVARVPAPHQGRAAGFVGAGGSAGQLLLGPAAQAGIAGAGWIPTLHGIAALTLASGALALGFRGAPAPASRPAAVPPAESTLRSERAAALRDPRFWWITASFFACGFHVSFLLAHMPGFIATCGLPATLSGAWLAIIGACNVGGSIVAGLVVERVSPRLTLVALYAARAAIVLAFALVPPTPTTVVVFSVAIGVTYMASLPPTTSLIGDLFGVRHLAVLFGVVLLVHQVGSFLGVWVGGLVIEATGNYTGLFLVDAALSVGAALACFAVREPLRGWKFVPARPALRFAPGPAHP